MAASKIVKRSHSVKKSNPYRRENISSGSAALDAARKSDGNQEVNMRSNVKRLRVEDALCYLDQVKQQFSDAPDVYVNFLDVMKDFKSQAIDTPGVIKRVSRLFRGRPNLIIAFNTFLPPGFDVTIEGSKVIITEPSGQRQIIDESRSETSSPVLSEKTKSSAAVSSSSVDYSASANKDQLSSSIEANAPNHNSSVQSVLTKSPEQESSSSKNTQSSEIKSTSFLSKRINVATYQDAVIYRNKVMGRFENRPEIYQKFLEVLQRLHHTTQETGISQAYKQAVDEIEALFEDDPDLIQEFKHQFEPKSSGSSASRSSSRELASKKKSPRVGNRTALVVSPQPVCVPKVQKWQGISAGKRAASAHQATVAKKAKLGRINVLTYDINVEEAQKIGTIEDYLFFDKPLCSGRTPLCDSVLNDLWVSFPSWSSEDSSAVHSKKTQYEEFVFHTEDERYELDIVIEVNKSALEVLEMVQRKMSRMKKEELSSFRLGPSLGGSSDSIMLRALQRIYGDHTIKMLEGAMKNPQVMVPRLIERMRQKDSEWRKNQEICNRIWRKETEKHYIRSLDHQATVFKQNDLKLRAKAIISEFENLYDERAERNEEGEAVEYGPHCIYSYPQDMSVLYDVNDLVIHYVKRQANIQKEEKSLAKRYLKRFLPELFNVPPQELSDEEDLGDQNADVTQSTNPQDERKVQLSNENETPTYRLFYGANTWCIFIRLHHLMCDRLAYLKKRHREIIENHEIEERICRERESIINRCVDDSLLKTIERDTKLGLSLLKPSRQNPINYYKTLITEIKNLLDGLIDSATFEESVRKLFGTAAYLTFTMDKIIITIARQLQNMSTEDANVASMNLYKKYRFERPVCLHMRGRNEENIDDVYERAAQEAFANQNCFKTFFLHETRNVTMELIDSDITEEADKADSDQEWSRYVHHYLESIADEPSSSTSNLDDRQHIVEIVGERPLLFLMKNIRAGIQKWRKHDDGAYKNDDGICESRLEKQWSSVTVNEDLHMQFAPAGNYKMRLASGSADILIRTGAPRRGINKHKMITARRKDRFHAWMEERLSEDGGGVLRPRNWLADGSRVVSVRHPDFPYIVYNRYFSSVSSTSSTASSNRSQH
ncbi:unnamed protein product [Thelazia callipaeda]|uniref:HDAC_interact domain-containing protein n=1 Tax=Thelazia callipaeda TaxID=103827 RepID=A0A0N5D6V0_THECL|nr:unnamed protein product [Thelazia callipaeda]